MIRRLNIKMDLYSADRITYYTEDGNKHIWYNRTLYCDSSWGTCSCCDKLGTIFFVHDVYHPHKEQTDYPLEYWNGKVSPDGYSFIEDESYEFCMDCQQAEFNKATIGLDESRFILWKWMPPQRSKN
jgi:hypothetical protein